VAQVEICCYYRWGRNKVPNINPPDYLDYEMWTGPAPMRPFNSQVHPRSWRNFMEYGNGIMGDMGIHMLDAVRWMLDLGAPLRVSSAGGIYMYPDCTPNTPDTQIATFDFGDLQVVWTHRLWGECPDPKYPWAFTIYGDKGTLKGSVMSYDFIPLGQGTPIHKDVTYEREQYPEDVTEKDIEIHVAPAVRYHMKDLLAAIASRSKPVADIEQGYISTTACILANMSLKLGRSLTWDAKAGRIVGDEEANRLLQRPYRTPWTHPDPANV
jgi:predicted dehydrogenase